MQIKMSTSPSDSTVSGDSVLTPGHPVPGLTVYRQVPGRVTTGVYLGDRSAKTTVCAATLRRKMQIELVIFTKWQYTETGPVSPIADHISPNACRVARVPVLDHWYDSIRGKQGCCCLSDA